MMYSALNVNSSKVADEQKKLSGIAERVPKGFSNLTGRSAQGEPATGFQFFVLQPGIFTRETM
jgi:hypothetical protein